MTLLEERLGLELSSTVIARAGGTRITVPAGIEISTTRSALERRFGPEVAAVLIFHFGGSVIYIPRNSGRHPLDDRLVARMTKRGKSSSEIALALQCSDRAVHHARARCKKKGLLPVDA